MKEQLATTFDFNNLNNNVKTRIGTRLAPYSALYKKNRTSGKAIREAYKSNVVFDLQVTDIHSPDCGKAATPDELRQLGYKFVMIRYNRDTDVMELEL
jgi:hypothetical protein